MIGLIRLTKMQAITTSCGIVIANRRFTLFRAYSFARNDAEVFV